MIHPSVEERLTKLAPDQRAAATAPPGPILCVAPAGSGKTTTLVARVAWLVAMGADPRRITAVTFNKRAAASEQFAAVEVRMAEALKKNPRSTALVLQLADLKDARGQFPEAEVLYRQALDRSPRDFVAANNLAWLLAQRPGQADEALRLIERAIQQTGPKPELLDTRAIIYLTQGKAEQAVADLEVATRDAPTGSRYFRLARAHKLANDVRAANKAWRQAKALDLQPAHLHPAERVAYQNLARELETR